MSRMPLDTPITASIRESHRCFRRLSHQRYRNASFERELPPAAPHVAGEVVLGALAPELLHAAVGRHAVARVQAHRRGVDDARVPDGEDHGHAESPARPRAGDQRVLVLDVDDLGPLAGGDPADPERGVAVEDGVGEPLRRHGRPARRGLQRKREPHDAEAVAFLARGPSVVGRDHRDPVAALQRGPGPEPRRSTPRRRAPTAGSTR